MRVLVLIPALWVAGCATQTQIPVSQASNARICNAVLFESGNYAVAQAEATRRGLDCQAMAPLLMQQRQAEAAALSNAARYFQPKPYQVPFTPMGPSVRCRTWQSGSQVYTDCN